METKNTTKILIYLSFILVGILYGGAYLYYYYNWASITDFPNHAFDDLAIMLLLMILCFVLPIGLMLIFGLINIIVKRLKKDSLVFDYFKKIYYYFTGITLIPVLILFAYTIYQNRFYEVTDYYPNGNKSVSVVYENSERNNVLYKMRYNENGDITEQFRMNNKIHISFKTQDYIEINGEGLSYLEIQKANLKKFMFPEIPEKANEINLIETFGGFPHLDMDLRVDFLLDKNDVIETSGLSNITANQFSYKGNTFITNPISDKRIKATLVLRNRL